MNKIRKLWLGSMLVMLLVSLARADNVTLNLKDADISALITTVSEVTDTNFIVDPRVKGKVTVISARPMDTDEVYQVFLSILKVHGFAAVPTGDVVKIVPDVNAKQDSIPTVIAGQPQPHGDEMVTQVVQVDNVSAAQLVPILRPLVPQQGHLAAYPATNMLIISDRADNVARLVNIIHRMDQQSDAEVEVIPLQHASAVEVVRILNSLQRSSGTGQAAAAAAGGPTLIADERTNSVLLGGDRAKRLRLRALITHLDTPLERGGNTHVVYLKYAKAADLTTVLTGVSDTLKKEQKAQQPKQLADISIQPDEAANALVITAPPDVYRSLQGVIRQLDVRRAQVYIEAVIAELSADKAAELGVQWRATDPTTGAGVIGGTSFDVTTPIGTVATNPLTGAGNGVSLGYFDGTTTILGTEVLNLGALVKALASDSENNILSTPTLVTLDNQQAEIIVAQNVPFVTGQFTNTGATNGATNPFQTIQRQDVGLTLRVTPQINEGDAIKLDIEQENSNISSTAVAGAADIITNKRSIKTSVMVEDRQVVVLGGLIDDRLTESVQKVPLLGDLPVLGNLFKSRRTTKTKQNLMVFLKPTILRDAATETEISSGKYNFMRAEQLKKHQRGANLMPNESVPLLPDLLEDQTSSDVSDE